MDLPSTHAAVIAVFLWSSQSSATSAEIFHAGPNTGLPEMKQNCSNCCMKAPSQKRNSPKSAVSNEMLSENGWKRREFVDALSLEVFKAKLDEALGSLV